MAVATDLGIDPSAVALRDGEVARAGSAGRGCSSPIPPRSSAPSSCCWWCWPLPSPPADPYDPTFLDPAVRLQGPSLDHPLGTDDRGRDIFSRVIYGGRVSLMIGVSVTLAAALIGSALGLMSGYFPRLDTPIMRTLDGLMAFPSILLAIAIMASLGTSAVNVFIALVVVYTPTIARLVRSTTLVTRQQPFVESARSIGMTDSQVLLRYVYPEWVLAVDRAVHLRRRLRHHLGGVALLPRRRSRSGDTHLGTCCATANESCRAPGGWRSSRASPWCSRFSRSTSWGTRCGMRSIRGRGNGR